MTTTRARHSGNARNTPAAATPAMPPTPDGDLLTVREVANRLRVDDTTVRRWIKSGVLSAIALPHAGMRMNYRIPARIVETLLQTPSARPAPIQRY